MISKKKYQINKSFFSTKTLLIIILINFSINTLFGQGKIESPYSRFGVGDLVITTSPRSIGMGNTNFAIPSDMFINFLNPAAVSGIDTLSFIFDFGINGGLRHYSIDNPELSQIKSDIQISHLIFGFRVSSWWATAFGSQPISNVAYDVISSKTNEFDVNTYYRYAGRGGYNKVYWSNAFSIIKNLSLGVNASYLFGSINKNNSINFDDESGAYVNLLQRTSTSISDFMFDFGIQYGFNFNSKNKLYIGAVYNRNSLIKGTNSILTFNSLSFGGSAIVDTINNQQIDGYITIPEKIGLGLCYQYNEKLLVGFDFAIQKWEQARFFEVNDSLSNTIRYSIGLEYKPIGKTGFAYRYSQSVSYRTGFYFNNSYMNLTDSNEQINDFGISFGLGLPLERSNTSFNLSVQLGQRGTLLNDLIKENYIIFALSFNLSDRWFERRRFD